MYLLVIFVGVSWTVPIRPVPLIPVTAQVPVVDVPIAPTYYYESSLYNLADQYQPPYTENDAEPDSQFDHHIDQQYHNESSLLKTYELLFSIENGAKMFCLLLQLFDTSDQSLLTRCIKMNSLLWQIQTTQCVRV